MSGLLSSSMAAIEQLLNQLPVVWPNSILQIKPLLENTLQPITSAVPGLESQSQTYVAQANIQVADAVTCVQQGSNTNAAAALVKVQKLTATMAASLSAAIPETKVLNNLAVDMDFVTIEENYWKSHKNKYQMLVSVANSVKMLVTDVTNLCNVMDSIQSQVADILSIINLPGTSKEVLELKLNVLQAKFPILSSSI